MTLSFEKNAHLLPKTYKPKSGKSVEFTMMEDRHLWLAWRWWFAHRHESTKAEYIYEALQREKERRAQIRAEERKAKEDVP